MITNIEISGFKRFHKQNFDFAPLTILTGLNGSGKTSLIQALLLTWEAAVNSKDDIVRLNGPFGMELGTAEDIRNWKANDLISIQLHSQSQGQSTWKMKIISDEALYLVTEEKPTNLPIPFSGQPRSFSYLCAERFGPRSILGTSPVPADKLEVGTQGEHCAHVLSAIGDKPLQYQMRLHPNRENNRSTFLKYEIEQWLTEIARPIEIQTIPYPGATVTALQFRSPGGEWVRAPNMGFGVSYSLPIVLAGLICQPHGIFIVENPEAHLHPAGQSRIGVFLGWLASRGIQVLVETHSDHVINGIRRAIAEYEYLNHTDAIVYFFEASDENEPLPKKLTFSEIGGISGWPNGFFDQYQIDVSALGRIRRKRNQK